MSQEFSELNRTLQDDRKATKRFTLRPRRKPCSRSLHLQRGSKHRENMIEDGE